MTENPLQRAALEYVGRGWGVIPLRFSGSVEDRKKPLLPSWTEYQERISTEAEVNEWWQRWPNANIGITTGKVSGLVVVDGDGPNCSELLRQKKSTYRKLPPFKLGRVIMPIMRIQETARLFQTKLQYLATVQDRKSTSAAIAVIAPDLLAFTAAAVFTSGVSRRRNRLLHFPMI